MNWIKRSLFISILAVVMPIVASAHSVSLTFTKSVDDTGATGQGYTMYRLSGTCPANVTTTAGFTALNSTLFTVNSYTDSTVVPGAYCYVATFTASSSQSVPSNTAPAVILPAAPTNVTVGSSN
jgi:hypothetical protein